MRKIGLLSLALVLALGSIGVGYAAWTQTLYIEGTVETGSVCIDVGTFGILDPYEPEKFGGDYPPIPADRADWTCLDGFVRNWDLPGGPRIWQLDKNVAWGDVVPVPCEETGLWKTLRVTLYNAYPSYFNEMRFYPENCGTLPWRIDHVIIRWDQGGEEQEFLILSEGTTVKMDYTGDGDYELEIQWKDSFGAQIHPGGDPPEISFWIHVLQPAPQKSTLEFTAELVVVQWNKYPLDLD